MNIEPQIQPLEQRFGTRLMIAIQPREIQAFRKLRCAADAPEFG